MKFHVIVKAFTLFFSICLICTQESKSQICEWRLANPTFSAVDPDGAGPATGSASFTLQIHTISGEIPFVTASSTGFSYQSSKVMLPPTVICPIQSSPPNVSVSAFFSAGNYFYLTVNECGNYIQNTGTEVMDKRAVGTMESVTNGVTLTTTWQDMFTVTLWTLGSSFPEGGYVALNSSEGGSPGEFTTFAVSDIFGNGWASNSLSFDTPLPLGGLLPVQFSNFSGKCSENGTILSWSTAQESNSSHFVVQRSNDGSSWIDLAQVGAAGNSHTEKNYQQIDLMGGNAFYRIKQVDLDGQVLYSDVTNATCNNKLISATIYPVPAKDLLNVQIKSDRSLKTQLQVFEASGKLVRKQDINLKDGNNLYTINLKGLAAGDYFLISSDKSIDLSKRFAIIR